MTDEKKSSCLQINASISNYAVREEMLEDQPHIVVPAVILVEGVHCGSNGCYLYSEETLRNSVNSWNGVPIPVPYHPTAPCDNPQILNEYNAGRLFNARIDGNKIKAEMWLNRARLLNKVPELYQKLMNSENVEVSTGLFPTELTEPGVWNDKEHSGEILNMKPDHVAILVNDIGACSVEDGCGIRNARTPSYEGTEDTAWGGVSKTLSAYIDGYYKHSGAQKPEDVPSTIAGLDAKAKQWIASKTLAGNATATTSGELISYPVVNPNTNKLNKGALVAAKQRGSQFNRNDVVSKANSLLKKEFEIENAKDDPVMYANQTMSYDDVSRLISSAIYDKVETDESYAYVSDIYPDYAIYRQDDKLYRIDYIIDEKGNVELAEPYEVRKVVTYTRVSIENKGETDMTDETKETPPTKEGVEEEVVEEAAANEQPGDATPAEETPAVSADEVKNQILEQLPENVREVLNRGLRLAEQEKMQLIEIIKNADGNRFTDEQLGKMPIEILENTALLVSAQKEDPAPLYLGNIGAPPVENAKD